LQQAYQSGQVRLVRRIHALLFVIEGKAIDEVAATLGLGAQTVRDYVNAFLWRGVASLAYRKPAGRPPKLTKTQRKELAALIKAGPEAAGYTTGCWSAVLIQDLILRTFGVEYHPHYLCTLLDQMGFSFQAPCLTGTNNDENVVSAPDVVHSVHRQRASLVRRSITRWYHESEFQADLDSLRYRYLLP